MVGLAQIKTPGEAQEFDRFAGSESERPKGGPQGAGQDSPV